MTLRLILCLLCFSPLLNAQSAGSPDNTFGTNGKIVHTLTIDGLLHGVAVYDFHVLPGEKILAVGIAKNGCSSTSNDFGIVFRLNNDGTLDTSFNNTGYRLFHNYYFMSIIPVNNNTFFVIENNHLLKINGQGEPDVTFGSNGFLSLDMQAYKGLFTHDGKIIVGGRKRNAMFEWELTVQQINFDGTLDSGFANNGTFTIPHVSGSGTSFGGMHIDSQNRLLLVGRRQVSNDTGKIIAFRLLNNGTYDSSFANAGAYFENVHYNARAMGIKTTANGNIILAGHGRFGPFDPYGMILIQLNENGILDTGFATSGRVHLPIYSESNAISLHILNDDSIVVTGGYQSTYIAKFDSLGSPVTNFGTNGVVNDFHFPWTGFNTVSVVSGNRILLSANNSFGHCAQQKQEALFMRHFLNEQGINLTAYPAPDLTTCDTSANGFATFDLTLNDNIIISGQSGATVSYHETVSDAQAGTAAIPNPQTYTNTSNPQTIYARIQDGIGNFDTTSFDLIVNPNPVPGPVSDMAICDSGNGSVNFDLNIPGAQIINGQPDMTATFYLTQAEAEAGTTGQLPMMYTHTGGPTSIYARMENNITGCFTIVTFTIEVVDAPPITSPITDYILCDNNQDGVEEFDLTSKENEILNSIPPVSVTITYHQSVADRTAGIAIVPANAYISGSQTIYFRVTYINPPNCYSDGEFVIGLHPPVTFNPPAPLQVCDEGVANGIATFNLNLATTQITGNDPNLGVTYYETQAQAETGNPGDQLPMMYQNQVPYFQTIWVRIVNLTTGCYGTAPLDLIVEVAPAAFVPDPLTFCDQNNDGFGTFTLTDADHQITGGAPGVNVTYHLTQADADNGVWPQASPFYNTVQYTQTLYARVSITGMDCYNTVELVLQVLDTPQLVVPDDLVDCDTNGNGIAVFDLMEVEPQMMANIPNPGDYNIFYYANATDMTNNDPITVPGAYTNTTSPLQTIYIVVEDNFNGCTSQVEFDLIVAQLFMAQSPDDIYIDEGDGDGIAVFDLTVNEPLMLGTQSAADITFSYFETLTNAVDHINAIQNPMQFVNTSNPQTIFVRMEHHLSTHCFLIGSFEIETDEFLSTYTPAGVQITLHPNPVNNMLFITTTSTIDQLEIVSLNGQKLQLPVYNLESNQRSIDFSGLATGVYLVKITTPNGLAVKRVIKQ